MSEEIVNWRNRAEAAEHRVMWLEKDLADAKDAAGCEVGENLSERIKKTRADLVGAVELLASWDQQDALEAAWARVKELEAQLAAAQTVPAHKLVADVMEAARTWFDATAADHRGKAQSALFDAIHSARFVVVQPVRTYTREEAEAKLRAYAEVTDGFGGRIENEEHAEMHEGLVADLMGVPQAQPASDAACRVCGNTGGVHKMSCYPHNREQHWSNEATASTHAPKGDDEAGGEGAAAAFAALYDAAMERVNAHQVALPAIRVPTTEDFERAPVGSYTLHQRHQATTKNRDGLWVSADGGLHFTCAAMAQIAEQDGPGATHIMVPHKGAAAPKVDHLALAEDAVVDFAPVTALRHIIAHLRART